MKSFVFLIPILLTGCGVYEDTFRCSPSSGTGCKSMSEVDDMINRGEVFYPLSQPCKTCLSKEDQGEFPASAHSAHRIYVPKSTTKDGRVMPSRIIYVEER